MKWEGIFIYSKNYYWLWRNWLHVSPQSVINLQNTKRGSSSLPDGWCWDIIYTLIGVRTSMVMWKALHWRIYFLIWISVSLELVIVNSMALFLRIQRNKVPNYHNVSLYHKTLLLKWLIVIFRSWHERTSRPSSSLLTRKTCSYLPMRCINKMFMMKTVSSFHLKRWWLIFVLIVVWK